MSNTPPAILDMESFLEALHVDPSSNKKKEVKILYYPSPGECFIEMYFEGEEVPVRKPVHPFIFEKFRQLSYIDEVKLAEVRPYLEFRMTEDVLIREEVNMLQQERLQIKQKREEQRARQKMSKLQ